MDTQTFSGLLQLNQVALTPDEETRALAFFAARDDDFATFADEDTSEVRRMVHVMPMENVLREDEIIEPFSREALQEGAPETMDGYWQVPRLVG